LDEGLPYRLAAFLIALGHDVTAVGRDYPSALADRAILEIAHTERRIVLTNDKDFGDLVVRDKLPHAGVILFRLGYVPLAARIALTRRVFDEHKDELDQIIVVTRSSIRVHPSS
jgi:predicted nuclease of predicted toxin-antitoxin system